MKSVTIPGRSQRTIHVVSAEAVLGTHRRVHAHVQASRDGSRTVPQRGTGPARVLSGAAVWLVWAASGLGVTVAALALIYGALNYHSLDALLTRVAPQALWAMSFPLV